MDVENRTYKVVTPSDGMWLYNEANRTISDKLYMPDEADLSGWVEIDEIRKAELEAQWNEEAKTEAEEGEENE